MNIKKRILTAILVVLVMATSVMLCACDNTPSEYKPKKFYGTYTQFANDYYLVVGSVYDEELGGWRAVIFDEIISIDGNTYVCIDSQGDQKVKEADLQMLAKAQELMDQIGTSITVKKNEIIYNDSGVVVKYDTPEYKGDWMDVALVFYKDGVDVGIGRYEEGQTTISVGFCDNWSDSQGTDYDIAVSKIFKK